MSYILGTRLVSDRQIKLALTKIFGIGPRKAIRVCDLLGLSDSIKVNNLTRHQIDGIGAIVRRNGFLIDSELRREIQRCIKRLINISCYRGLRYKAGLPLRGQRTRSNAKTCRKLIRISINQQKKNSNSQRHFFTGRGGRKQSAKKQTKAKK